MIEIYRRATNANSLHEDFSALKLDEHLKLLDMDMYSEMNIRRLCHEPVTCIWSHRTYFRN
jgi:hypothetical protein